MLERFHCLSVLFFKEKSVFLSSSFSPSLRCPEIATRARSSLIRKYDLCASFLCFHSFFRPSVPALVINSFIVRVLFLARHTLINEFFLFRLSFLARTLAILHFAITATIPFFFLLSPSRKLSSSYPILFLTAITDSHGQSPALQGALQPLVAFPCHPFSLASFPFFSGDPFRS